MFFVLSRTWDKETIQSPDEESNTRSSFSKNSEFFLCSTLVKRRKASISISLPSSKLTISLFLFYKYDAIDIADPSSMRDACHVNFLIDLARRSLCVSVVEYRSAKSEDLRFNSSWGLRIFSLSHARDKMKKILTLSPTGLSLTFTDNMERLIVCDTTVAEFHLFMQIPSHE